MELSLMIEGQEDVTWRQWLALAAACEEHGIPTLFRSDHYLNLDGRHPERTALDAWTSISGLAARTTTLRLGVMASPATFRHPSNLAKVVTAADHVSDGRVELGIGAGWHEREHDAYGFAFADVRTRMDILEEQLQVIAGHWAEGSFSFEGEHYTLRDLCAHPKPIQRPHPPLIMGGNAGPRSARLAAAYADEYNTAFPTVGIVRERRANIARACHRAGRNPIPFSVMTGVLVGSDRTELLARAHRVSELLGIPGGAGAFVEAPPQGWIVGTVSEAADQLGALRDEGVVRVLCQHVLHDDLDAIALLGREVAPLVA